MKYIRQTFIILSVMMVFTLLGAAWSNVLLIVLSFILAAMAGIAATTFALADEDPSAPAVSMLPSGLFMLIIFLSTPAGLHPILGWSAYFGLLIGSAGVLAALAWGFGEDGED